MNMESTRICEFCEYWVHPAQNEIGEIIGICTDTGGTTYLKDTCAHFREKIIKETMEKLDCCQSCKHWTTPTRLGMLGRCAALPGETHPLHTCNSFVDESNVENCGTCRWWVFAKTLSPSDQQEIERMAGEGPWGRCQYEPKSLWHESTYFCSKWTDKK